MQSRRCTGFILIAITTNHSYLSSNHLQSPLINLHQPLDSSSRMIRVALASLCLLSLPAASGWLTTGGAAPPLLRPALPPLGALARLPPSDDGEGSLPESGVDWDSAWSAELAKRSEGKREWRPEGREAVSAEQVAKAKAKRTVSASLAWLVGRPPITRMAVSRAG